MSEHTPGPWGFDSFALREEIRAENNPLIATVCSVHCDSPEEMRANAHLIAAAPEILWTLEKLVERVGGDEWFAEWAGMARAAIAKAKGEE